ncbi:MAG: aspartate aminotransferase family protein [Gemmatimonadales bacterium]
MDPLERLSQTELARFEARTAASGQWYRRAAEVMPGGDTRTGTYHLPFPLFIAEGQGARVRDADGNEYLDFLNNFTSLLHGHAHPAILAALEEQARRGTVHGSANPLQVRLAETIRSRVPSVERLRFCNSGTEATLFALRAAKAATGKSRIMKMAGGYHGSHDQVAVAMAPPYGTGATLGLSPGALAEVTLGRFNDLDYTADLIRRNRDALAAVIVEPMMGSGGALPADPAFLRGLREVTADSGVLLILDEIITFRLGFGGLQETLGIRPDLTTFGKIIGGGLPVGAFGGRADVMASYDPTRPGTITHSGTYNGNAATMAAGLAALEQYPRAEVARLNGLGDRLRAGMLAAIDEAGVPATVTGYGSVLQVHFAAGPLRTVADTDGADRRLGKLLHLAQLNRGVFAAARQMYVLSTPMSEREVDDCLGRFADALGTMARAGASRPTSVAT